MLLTAAGAACVMMAIIGGRVDDWGRHTARAQRVDTPVPPDDRSDTLTLKRGGEIRVPDVNHR